MLTAEPNGDLSGELHLQNGQMKFALLISVKVMVLFNKKWTTELEVTIKDFISTAVGCVAELIKNSYDVPGF